jgi:hypothetical protein
MSMTKEAQWESKYKGASRFADGSAIVRPEELPWTSGPLAGLSFRLTHIDRQSGMWTAIFKADPNATIPAHYTYGQVQYYIRAGGFVIDGVQLQLDDYYLDQGGAIAARKVGPEGVTCFVVYEGGLADVDGAGKPSGPYMDCNCVYELAMANGAGEHLPVPGR